MSRDWFIRSILLPVLADYTDTDWRRSKLTYTQSKERRSVSTSVVSEFDGRRFVLTLVTKGSLSGIVPANKTSLEL